MKYVLLIVACCAAAAVRAQELYPFTEPASNMPAHSVSAKASAMYSRMVNHNRLMQRYSPEVMFGLNKDWMLHLAATASNMQQSTLAGESIRVYAKYRFLSNDAVHEHFRMAAFALGSYTRNKPLYNELNLLGDYSGVQAGVIATQLVHKFAASGTLSLVEVLDDARWKKETEAAHPWQAVNYSLSAGLLLFPINYTSYKQTNVNLYAELLGMQNLNFPTQKGFIDVAPAIQFIFNSTSKLNLGYRFQLAGDVARPATNSFMISYEQIFLNALRRRN